MEIQKLIALVASQLIFDNLIAEPENAFVFLVIIIIIHLNVKNVIIHGSL